jgi:Secretion system C-terminal sorting domain
MKTKSTLVLFLIGCLIFTTAAHGQSNSSFVFATNDVMTSGAKLMKVNKSTGAVTNVGSLLFSSSGCAFDPFSQRVYYVEAQSGGSAPYDLAYYDLMTNTNTMIGSGILGTNAFVKLAINPTNGKMYGIESDPQGGKTNETLYELNKTTGAKTLIKTVLKVTGTANGDLAFDRNGICYYVAADQVYILDVTTGAITPFVTTSPSNTKITGIIVDENLDLLISTYQNPGGSCSGSGDWIAKIDLPGGKLTCIGNANTTLGDLTGGYGVAGVSDMLVTLFNWGNTYTVTFEIKVKNYGMSRLDNLQITDDLKAVFGTRLTSASVSATGILPAGISINPLYDGSTNTSLLGASNYLSYNSSAGTEFTLRVNATIVLAPADMNKIFYIQPKISSTDPAGNVLNDFSDDGMNPNANNNNSAHETGEDDPTPFTAMMSLPVKLAGFTATANSGKVVLDWKTATEANVKHFAVEASTDGINFNRTIKVVSASNNSNGSSYSVIDEQPGSGLTYYRLKMVDIDESATYSMVRIITLATGKPGIRTFPNPAISMLNVQLPANLKGATTFQIINMQGSVVKTIQAGAGAGNVVPVSLEKLTNGVYILQVKNAGTITSIRFVKL